MHKPLKYIKHIVTIKCPHCRALRKIDTNGVNSPNERVLCASCYNDYPAHLWEVVKPEPWCIS